MNISEFGPCDTIGKVARHIEILRDLKFKHFSIAIYPKIKNLTSLATSGHSWLSKIL